MNGSTRRRATVRMTLGLCMFLAAGATASADPASDLQTLYGRFRETTDPQQKAQLGGRVLTLADQVMSNKPADLADRYMEVGWVYFNLKQYERTEAIFRRAIALKEKGAGRLHISLVGPLHALGDTIYNQALQNKPERFSETIPLYQRAAQIREKQLGSNHAELALSLHEYGLSCMKAAKYADAATALRRALRIRESQLGAESAEVQQTLSVLAETYYWENKYEEAQPLFERSVKISEQLNGDNSLVTAAAIYQLAMNLHFQKRYADAEPLFKRVVAVRTEQLGADDPLTIYALRKYGDNVYYQAKYAEAVPIYEQVLARSESFYGVDHLEVAQSLWDLGYTLYMLEKYVDAQPILQRCATIREEQNGLADVDTAFALQKLGDAFYYNKQYTEAVTPYGRALEAFDNAKGDQTSNLATACRKLADANYYLAQYADAQPYYERALTLFEKTYGEKHAEVAVSLNDLGWNLWNLNRFADAEPILRRCVALREELLGPDDAELSRSLVKLADVLFAQRRHLEAQPLYERACAIREKALGDDPDVAFPFMSLGDNLYHLRRYAEADQAYAHSLEIRRQKLQPTDSLIALSLQSLASVDIEMRRFAAAEQRLKEALEIQERAFGADNHNVAACLDGLARVRLGQGRFAEAESLAQRALSIRERATPLDESDLAYAQCRLGAVLNAQGRYVESEELFRSALAIRERLYVPDDPLVGESISLLADLLREQNRHSEAEPMLRRALEIQMVMPGPDSLDVAWTRYRLAVLLAASDRAAEAEPMFGQVLESFHQAWGDDHTSIADCISAVADMRAAQDRLPEAETLYRQVLAMREKLLGPEHPEVAQALYDLGSALHRTNRQAEAMPLLDRAIDIQSKAGISLHDRFLSYNLRANVAWKLNKRGDALADLKTAMRLAEELRGYSSGAEQERAQFFGGFVGAFERMVAWQTELGDIPEALSAIERSRARSLLDEMGMQATDLEAGRPLVERQQLAEAEGRLNTRIAELETALKALMADQSLSAAARLERRKPLEKDLAEARDELYKHYRQARASNATYKIILDKYIASNEPPRLGELQRRLVREDGLLLLYLLGQEGGFVLAIDAEQAQIKPLTIDAAAATALGVDAGPLTGPRLQTALMNAERTGVLQLLQKQQLDTKLPPKLAALWNVLVPAAERARLTSGKLKRLLVVPDGPLAFLPFETLVVKPGAQPAYLLDVGPAISYGPSAKVLYLLAARPTQQLPPHREPVLTVGDPSYESADGSVQVASSATNGPSQSRYSMLGMHLPRLPYSATESQWVSDVFAKQQLGAVRLVGRDATEAHVRTQIADRRLLHLACHGLTDQTHGNFYGALALTPNEAATADPANDGFLTLAEIYSLNLRSCELTILSACQTNYGPEQQGEGIWALSRGFLVAGSRRVVASNWVVDDEAAASLVSMFCSGVAKAEHEHQVVDYAGSLHEAKRRIRRQDKWSSPYYWGTFVLVGP
jgi:tetratricopeptide (TPR) repeat protein